MANADSPGGSSARQQQRRRWSVGRSSTPRNHFSLHSSEAFYASTEPLSGGRGGRALHNASSGGGGGPDPDSNSVLDSYAPETGGRQQYRAAAARRTSQDSSDRRASVARSETTYYTVPRGPAVSRKEILRRRCVKDDVETTTLHSTPEKDQVEKRPRTLPSTGRRARQDTEQRSASSLLKRVSRQDILQRRATIEASSQLKDVARTSSGFPNSGRSAKESRDLSRPSTLPKVVHASKMSRLEEHSSSSRTREAAGREAPIYGKIRRRKMSLPTGAATLRDSTVTPSSTLTRFSRAKANGERADATTKVIRHLRDPFPDPPDRSRSGTDNVTRDDIYVKVARKSSRQAPREERLEPVDRTMSRRRIISNASETDSLERRMHQDRDQDVVRVKHDAILVSKTDIDRLRNFKTGRNDLEDAKTSYCADSTWSRRKNSKTDSWSRDKCPHRDSTWTSSERQERCRPKSQSELLTNAQLGDSKTGIRSTTLPSYVKIGRKTSTGNLPARNVDEQRRVSTSGVLTKQSKERSNYVRKTATCVPTHVRALSDANSARSNSPDMPSSIFGFCTGKRRMQVARRSQSWNWKTVRNYLWIDSKKYTI
ncbi:uncharacterized protein LOC120359309 [Solenopsis invicta]|uniref:uncharacterized protein LOC120359309 n=1 Tax=Solenopsis invicta TaxID=13686 RepID=UPI00193D4ABC|nr:uncharacterized protein LOC120359309 [Solenopsis invicta]